METSCEVSFHLAIFTTDRLVLFWSAQYERRSKPARHDSSSGEYPSLASAPICESLHAHRQRRIPPLHL